MMILIKIIINDAVHSKSEIDQRGGKCPKFYENRPKGPVTVWRVVNHLKNQYKWPQLGLLMTEWPSKYRFLDQCRQSYIHHEIKSREYLARFYTFNSIKKIKILTGQPSLLKGKFNCLFNKNVFFLCLSQCLVIKILTFQIRSLAH